MKLSLFICFLLSILSCSFSAPIYAAESSSDLRCPKANVLGPALFSKVCWDCHFPLYALGIKLWPGDQRRPKGANTQPLCLCTGTSGTTRMIGGTIGAFWPTKLLETTKVPYCFPTLFGTMMSGGSLFKSLGTGGGDAGGRDDLRAVFLNVHQYAFPLMYMLELSDNFNCNPEKSNGLDIMFISEFMPQWSHEPLSFYLHPEGALLAGNPIAQAAQIVDCTAASAPGSTPFDEIFFASGCWGHNYPVAGFDVGDGSMVSAESLLTTRFMFLLSRIGVLKKNYGSDNLCKNKWMPVLKKTPYRLQRLWPMSESSTANSDANGSGSGAGADDCDGVASCAIQKINIRSTNEVCCHNIGESTLIWGEWRHVPVKPDAHAVYLMWEWQDCCAGYAF
jgi:conjugal transfer pilus assembly protein TraU